MKGVIIAAGYGTRFLPVTKTVPKEMLPLVDKPAAAFIVEEFIASGIDEILIITSRRKKALDDFFDREMELEGLFRREGAAAKLARCRPYEADIYFKRQTEMMGTGHALLQARAFVKDEPFAVAYPDDLHFGRVPLTRQLLDEYRKTECTVLATLHNPPEINRYGVLTLYDQGPYVKTIVEKPEPGTEPSREASIGRFVYTPDILAALQEGWDAHCAGPGAGSEYFHTYALQQLMDRRRVVYRPAQGIRLDTGAPEGYLRALVRYAFQNPSWREAMLAEIEQIRDLASDQD